MTRTTKYVDAPVPKANPWFQNNKEIPNKENIPQSVRASVSVLVPNSAQNQYSASNSVNNKNTAKSDNPQELFKDLVSEFSTLNQSVDLLKMLNLVRELNSELKNCSNNFEKFMTINNFCQTKLMANDCSQLTWP